MDPGWREPYLDPVSSRCARSADLAHFVLRRREGNRLLRSVRQRSISMPVGSMVGAGLDTSRPLVRAHWWMTFASAA